MVVENSVFTPSLQFAIIRETDEREEFGRTLRKLGGWEPAAAREFDSTREVIDDESIAPAHRLMKWAEQSAN